MAMGGSAQRQAKVDFLPVCRADMEARGWGELDFLFVNGDAYVDHPSFAAPSSA